MQWQWGHANYASGNTFLGASVHYHHLVAVLVLALEISAIKHGGYCSQITNILDKYNATSYLTLREEDLLDSVQLMINRSNPL